MMANKATFGAMLSASLLTNWIVLRPVCLKREIVLVICRLIRGVGKAEPCPNSVDIVRRLDERSHFLERVEALASVGGGPIVTTK